MTTPRATLVDQQNPRPYHLITRCVRRSFLCGKDHYTRRDFSHRKQWLIERIHHLTSLFAIDVYGYSIMSNHFHMVVYYDPKDATRWTDEEVARRWTALCPPKFRDGKIDEIGRLALHQDLLDHPERLLHARRTLGSLSMFMKFLKQPIAYRANREDDCTGHFFEQRFYSGVLLDEQAMLHAMEYVDLNPVRAQLARKIHEIENASICERLAAANNSRERIEAELALTIQPIASGILTARFRPNITVGDYIEEVKVHIRAETGQDRSDKAKRWLDNMRLFKRHQRAYGPTHLLKEWLSARGMQMRELACD